MTPEYMVCPGCNGTGVVECDHPEADDIMECADCDGEGLQER